MLIPIHPAEPDNPDLLVNTRIEYLYRDAANWKQHNEAVVAGRFSEQDINDIMASLDMGENFIPSKIGLPEQRFDTSNDDDVLTFELSRAGFIPTTAEPTVKLDARTVTDRFKANKNRWFHGLGVSPYV